MDPAMQPPHAPDVLSSFYAALPAPVEDAADEPVSDVPIARAAVPVAGLPNAGNTCYAACALQLLAAAPDLAAAAARDPVVAAGDGAGGVWAELFQRYGHCAWTRAYAWC